MTLPQQGINHEGDKNMGEYRFGVKGKKRKELVSAISEILETPAKYLGVPTCNYQVGDYYIDREGTVTGEFNLTLFAALEQRGFEYEPSKTFHLITPRGTFLIQERFDTAEEANAAGYGNYFHHEGRDVYTKPTGNGEHCKYFAVVGAPFEKVVKTPETRAELEAEPTSEPETDNICIELPLNGFTPETIDNLCKMVTAKEPLIKKALGVETLPIKVLENSIAFAWFNADHSENMMAYAHEYSL
jgi:hypothetical protein